MFENQLPHEMAGQPDTTPDAQDEIARIIAHEAVAGYGPSPFSGYRGIFHGRLDANGMPVRKVAPAVASPVKPARPRTRIIGQR